MSTIFKADPIRLAEPVSATQQPIAGYSPPMTAEEGMLATNAADSTARTPGSPQIQRRRFRNPIGIGFRGESATGYGFVSHRFTEHPTYNSRRSKSAVADQAIDLVSLLKHDEPVAYVSKNLPPDGTNRAMPTRPLDELSASGCRT